MTWPFTTTVRKDGAAAVCRERLAAVERYLDAPFVFDADHIPAWIVLEVVGPWTDGCGGWVTFTFADCIDMAQLCAAYYRRGVE